MTSKDTYHHIITCVCCLSSVIALALKKKRLFDSGMIEKA